MLTPEKLLMALFDFLRLVCFSPLSPILHDGGGRRSDFAFVEVQ
jgi:hypothetical protein